MLIKNNGVMFDTCSNHTGIISEPIYSVIEPFLYKWYFVNLVYSMDVVTTRIEA